ncbi:hypothetical protein BpHYR1_035622 [Brachionus plicatilis]|uniref:Uncharacterized protein n=1 Tax=Brachionus plicatilis TaxID=10195 RepID=A0A3M7RQA7_BRAPC|nr:hypothetical protein BpHYR1_035622 [Brachionus plicatilis]
MRSSSERLSSISTVDGDTIFVSVFVSSTLSLNTFSFLVDSVPFFLNFDFVSELKRLNVGRVRIGAFAARVLAHGRDNAFERNEKRVCFGRVGMDVRHDVRTLSDSSGVSTSMGCGLMSSRSHFFLAVFFDDDDAFDTDDMDEEDEPLDADLDLDLESFFLAPSNEDRDDDDDTLPFLAFFFFIFLIFCFLSALDLWRVVRAASLLLFE